MNETDFIKGFVRGFNEGFAHGQKQKQNEVPVAAILDNGTGSYINTDNAPQIWIARDKNGRLWLCRCKPVRSEFNWGGCLRDDQLEISFALFPEVKWDDKEPKRVKLILVEE